MNEKQKNQLGIILKRVQPLIKYLLFAIAIISLSKNIFADPAFLTNDPKRPVDNISHDLGIESQQFVECFQNVNPAAQGARPSADRVHSNKEGLLNCLQKANPDITNDKLDEVMDRYRAGGREAQEPEGE